MGQAKWAKPEYSRTGVENAGRILADPSHSSVWEYFAALDVLDNWRSSHSFPLNAIQTTVRRKAKRIDASVIVAQRLKRRPSIVQKLHRLSLCRIQDIGGCRAVLPKPTQVKGLLDDLVESRVRHALYRVDDYVDNPRQTGYRSVHLLYRYKSDRRAEYDNLRIEVQLRSKLQHAWATAVETVSTFLGEPLKAGKGPQEWLDFFAMASSAFAYIEGTAEVPDTPRGSDLIHAVKRAAEALGVHSKLETYGKAIQVITNDSRSTSRAKNPLDRFLLFLVPDQHRLEVYPFREDGLTNSSSPYLEMEQRAAELPGSQVVLVGAESVRLNVDKPSKPVLVREESADALRQAYPNYFLDTQLFLDALDGLKPPVFTVLHPTPSRVARGSISMEPVSLTTFVDFVSKAGSPKLTVVRNWKQREDYSPSRDFYKWLREGITEMHRNGLPLTSLDDVIAEAKNERKRLAYTELVEQYCGWCREKRNAFEWFDPPSCQWRYDELAVNVNPELGLLIGGEPHLIKLYFKADHLMASRIATVTHMMETSCAASAPDDCKMAVLDIHTGRLHVGRRNPSTESLLRGEAAYWLTVWPDV